MHTTCEQQVKVDLLSTSGPADVGSFSGVHCFVYVPNVYNGTGTTQTLVWIVEHFEGAGIRPTLFFERTWEYPNSVHAESLLPSFLEFVPGRWTKLIPKRLFERAFLRRLFAYSPRNAFVYVWPQPRLALVKTIKAHGFCIFREMINCPVQVHEKEVGKARDNFCFPRKRLVSERQISDEKLHLELSDFVTAPNAEVERALQALGIPRTKILPCTFGWATERFPSTQDARFCTTARADLFTVLFVGRIEVRKGVPYLLAAWNDMPAEMHLQLVGSVDPELSTLLEGALQNERVTHHAFTTELDKIFRSADVFVFPTVEEGGPQVTLEAAGCGLPVITTPMGSARLIADGRNGLIVPAHDVQSLRAAMLDLFRDPQKRNALARQAENDAKHFTYKEVGASRASIFKQKFAQYLGTHHCMKATDASTS